MKNQLIPNWSAYKIELINKVLNKNLQKMILISIFISVFLFVFQAKAQTAQTVQEYLTEEEDTENLKKLIFEHVPTIFIQNNEVSFLDKGFAQKLICDVSSLKILETENSDFRTVKLIQVELRTSEEKSRIRLSPESLKFFPNVSKILISSMVPLSIQEVNQMLNGYQEGDIILLYQINNDF